MKSPPNDLPSKEHQLELIRHAHRSGKSALAEAKKYVNRHSDALKLHNEALKDELNDILKKRNPVQTDTNNENRIKEEQENFPLHQAIKLEFIRLGIIPNVEPEVQPQYRIANKDGVFIKYCLVPKRLNNFRTES